MSYLTDQKFDDLQRNFKDLYQSVMLNRLFDIVLFWQNRKPLIWKRVLQLILENLCADVLSVQIC